MAAREFEWDPAKADANLRKHRVSFSDAATVFDDARAITTQDPDATGEQRFVSMGMDATGRVLVLVFSLRGETVRIISARRATSNERFTYMIGR